MDDEKFNDWFNDNYDSNALLFAEHMGDEFNYFCLRKFDNLESDDPYDRWKDEQWEKQNEKVSTQ